MELDLKFVNPVVKTLMSVFTTMIQLEPVAGDMRVKSDDIASGDVTGILKMDGDTAKGSVSISFTKPVVIDLVKRMLHMDIQEIDEIARDLAGEMANIVVGGAKNLLEEQGYKIDMSLPEVFEGEGHQIKHYFDGETVEIPFKLDSGDFYIEVNFVEPV
ncbi:MAG: chemotaxis protein CheX [Gammaproteobacteria bacterium]|nr:chemotaxis protein CheX [Gammaproteobacteria bacterium]